MRSGGGGLAAHKLVKDSTPVWGVETWRQKLDHSLNEEGFMLGEEEEFAACSAPGFEMLGELSEEAFISEMEQSIESSAALGAMSSMLRSAGSLPFLKMESAESLDLGAALATTEEAEEEAGTPSTVEAQEDSSTEDYQEQAHQAVEVKEERYERSEAASRSGSKSKRGTGPAISKWRKRDVAKHLAGERSRRAKRMGKVHTLKEMLPALGNKPTVNQILTAAIDAIKAKMAEREAAAPHRKKAMGPRESASVISEIMRSSPSVGSLALDKNMCVVEASESLCEMIHWRGGEGAMRGQHLSAIMRPDDCMAISHISETIRNYNNLPREAGSARVRAMFNSFAPLDGFDASAYGFGSGFSFASGCLPPCEVLVSVSNGSTVLTIV
eukprot:CAMPEP_0184319146 /NCGR_PEP_ID=MMETSP1049-20130417/106736_1 /TAXON_ID=77928 /ORGANISM="Proteomonas sulcata, Strain CCMP704" /LENGTH=383 /DNA_ID=CAMNT_0026639165 /DNA_START=93 /DNA_END=1244 /DNA_ORIENTATION=+